MSILGFFLIFCISSLIHWVFLPFQFDLGFLVFFLPFQFDLGFLFLPFQFDLHFYFLPFQFEFFLLFLPFQFENELITKLDQEVEGGRGDEQYKTLLEKL